ncbi:hypothetical protein [Biformimicrobium ophioploci]|uniref:Uncharacterized protein n=1 Tax=Biformimicrobium ophioploci TaxID=3036711 RepID=A0ABQ6LVI0_9GAMM|nr:hypothetical protein [Microbulbifer sp. NKW57]GMG86102.1 hypothetical protein MNKW57_04230 [Microbulbifer sp. NKW57]
MNTPHKNRLRNLLTTTIAVGALAGAGHAAAQLPGLGLLAADAAPPALALLPAEIDLEMPMDAHAMQVLLAEAGGNVSLTELQKSLSRPYLEALHGHLYQALNEHFRDEEVALLDDAGLKFASSLQLDVSRQITDVSTKSRYELERGTLVLRGTFAYQIQNAAGNMVQERTIDVESLKISTKYQIKSWFEDDRREDNSQEALQKSLEWLVKRVLAEIDGDLEAEDLRELV